MTFIGSHAAISHTGKVRSNNQDSGYAGSNLFVVADGMGGHAGGDVASAVAIQQLQVLDAQPGTAEKAEAALRSTITTTAGDLARIASQRKELAGLGTTVDALLMVDDLAVIAHIGDSRIYLFRDDTLTQITTDHTFVQKLVDSGRITPEEARYHPRRSVLMRVLGDMDPDPEVDTFIMPTLEGDRWVLCSDGLSGVVDEQRMARTLRLGHAPGRTADMLLKFALDGGAPDNVTIVIVDVGGAHPTFSGTPTIVGSASNPQGVDIPAARPALSTNWLHPNRAAANEPTHFEPEPEYLEELIAEDRRRRRRRQVGVVAMVLVLAGLIAGGFAIFVQWTQTRYFVGADETSVVVYQGIPQQIGPVVLSNEHTKTDLKLADLPQAYRAQVERTIPARSLDDAIAITERLRGYELAPGEDDATVDGRDGDDLTTPSPSPAPTPSVTPSPTETP